MNCCKLLKMNKLPIFIFFIISGGVLNGQDFQDSTILFNGKSLDGWEITNYGPQGPVYLEEGNIIFGIGDGLTGVTWKKDFPTRDYELSLQAKRLSGTDFFCGLTFPVYDSHITLILGGWGGALVGLSSIDGKDASENHTKQFISFKDNVWYKVTVQVFNDYIKVWLNHDQIIDFQIDDHDISVRSDIDLAKPLGISSWNTKAAIRDVYYCTAK